MQILKKYRLDIIINLIIMGMIFLSAGVTDLSTDPTIFILTIAIVVIIAAFVFYYTAKRKQIWCMPLAQVGLVIISFIFSLCVKLTDYDFDKIQWFLAMTVFFSVITIILTTIVAVIYAIVMGIKR